MNEFLQRLQQRKLVQWALAYAAASFALLQGIDIVAGKFGWPESIERLLIITLCVGFFVTLLLAWYHGEQGRQRASGTELLLIALVLGVGGGLLWHFARVAPSGDDSASAPAANKPLPTPSVGNGASPAARAPAKSIAVLPFENLSADKDNEYFASGMQDLILTKLADIGDLKVVSRTSTAKYASHPDDLKTIARQLDVANILEGSVQKAGNQVLINVQLIDVATDQHLWAQAYTRTLDNIFGVEGEVATMIAEALKAKLTPREVSQLTTTGTHDQRALDSYLRAGYYVDKYLHTGDIADWKRSLDLLQQTVQFDPGYANAWATLALTYSRFPEYRQQQREAVQRALQLAPDNADAHRQMAFVLSRQGDHAQALAEAERAVALAPKSLGMLAGLGHVQMVAGKLDASIATYRKALSMPDSKMGIPFAVKPMVVERRYAEARDLLQNELLTRPDDVYAASDLAYIELDGWGDIDAARATLQSIAAKPEESLALALAWVTVYSFARDYSAAAQLLERTPQAVFKGYAWERAVALGATWRSLGQTAKAQAAYAEARDEIRQSLTEMPDEASLHAGLALALSGLDDHPQAIGEAKRAMALRSVTMDAATGPYYIAMAAQVDAEAGDSTAAIAKLRQLLAMPAGGYVSVPLLKLDPAWDPIRKDPRFQALLNKGAEPTSTADERATTPR